MTPTDSPMGRYLKSFRRRAIAKYWRSPAVFMLARNNTRSCRHRSAMIPVSAKNLVLAFVLFSSAALNESWQPSRVELGTFIPGSRVSTSSLGSAGCLFGGGLAARGGRASSTNRSASSSSVWVRKTDIGWASGGSSVFPFTGFRRF